MKKFVRITLIVASCLLAVGLLTGGLGLAWFWSTADRLTPEPSTELDTPVDVSQLTSLRIDLSLGNVTILPVPEGGESSLKACGYTEGELLVNQADGVLSIESADGIRAGSLLDLGLFRIDFLGRLHMGSVEPRSVTLYLPEADLQAIDISTSVGDVEISVPLRAEMVSIASSVGSLSLQDVQATQLNLSSDVGSATADGFACDILTVSVDTGDLTLRSGHADTSASIQTNIGDTTLQDVTLHALTLRSSTGDVFLEGKLRGDCTLETDFSDLTLCFADSAENYSLDLDLEMGDLSTANAELFRTEEGNYVNPQSDAENRIAVKVNVGGLDLSFAE